MPERPTISDAGVVSGDEAAKHMVDINLQRHEEPSIPQQVRSSPQPSSPQVLPSSMNVVVTENSDDGAVRLMKHSTNSTTGNGDHHHQRRGPYHLHRPRRRATETPLSHHHQQQQFVIDDENDVHHPIEEDDNLDHPTGLKPPPESHLIPPKVQLTEQDVALCQALDMEYERALEERQIAWTSRYQSVRQSTVVSIVFMILFICIGTIFFIHQASLDNTYWSISEGLLFSIYTITTVGYGHLEMPNTMLFQWYIIIYIFVGIATLTILVAQIYQCISLETNRVAVHANDVTTSSARQQQRSTFTTRTTTKMRQWVQYEQQQRRGGGGGGGSSSNTSIPTTSEGEDNQNMDMSSSESGGPSPYSGEHNAGGGNVNGINDYPPSSNTIDWVDVVAYMIQIFDVTIAFLRENEYGRSISVLLPFVILITIGAAVIGPIEGWTVTESIYFSVVSLTTVGFGDYYPTKNASIWFCCLWLPFSVGFMSLYLGNVATFYIRLSDRNIARIENVLRKRIQSIKEKAQLERRAVLRRALRGQQQHGDNLDPHDQGSNDGGSSMDDDLAFTTTMDEEIADDGNVDGTELPNRIKSTSRQPSKRNRLNSNRLFGFSTIPSDDRFDTEAGAGGGASATGDGGDNSIHSINNSIYSSTIANTSQRRERILRDSMKHMEFARNEVSKSCNDPPISNIDLQQQRNLSMTMTTMKDVLRSVHQNNMIQPNYQQGDDTAANMTSTDTPSTDLSVRSNSRRQPQFQSAGPESEYLSVRSNRTVLQFDSNTIRKKPSFALRALVQERFAEIIATDVAGYQSSIEVKDCTLTVSIDVLKKVAEKWLIPRRARKAFRAVSFEALYFVGEHGLITRGADALFSLSPIEFHQIFSPLLASFGDAETMESWLERTQPLADVDLSTSFETQSDILHPPSFDNTGSLKVAPKTSANSSTKDFNRSQSLPATVLIPSPPKGKDELPEIS